MNAPEAAGGEVDERRLKISACVKANTVSNEMKAG